MNSRTIWRSITTLVVMSMLAALVPLTSVAAPSQQPVVVPMADPEPPQGESALLADGYVPVRVVAPAGTDLSKYGRFVTVRIPDVSGQTVYYGQVAESVLPALQSDRRVSDVGQIQAQAPVPETQPDPDLPADAAPNLEEVRARLIALRDNPPEPTQRPEPTGWWDVSMGGHNAVEAWQNGYTGAGVKTAVIDTGVDMAHPDLWGTEARFYNVTGDPYYDYFDGWPMALSPFSNYLLAYDYDVNGGMTLGNTFAYGYSYFANTHSTRTGDVVSYGGQSYTTSGTAHPLNPVYHIGYHPDWSLEQLWGYRIGVLVVDEDGDQVYDTVYVDLNGNRDFRDDKPVRKDTNLLDNYVQGADELSYWDADNDGYPDVSGGMVYFIADGEHCPPFFDVYFGCSATGTGWYPAPGNGNLVAFMFANFEGDWGVSHGQWCASNVVGQGNINGSSMDGYFPALKPDGMGGMVQGAGLMAQVVPVGDIYIAFEQSVEQAWWFQALGYDGILGNGAAPWGPDALDVAATPGATDNIQASSNSFGLSGAYEGGWDEWSRVVSVINLQVNPFTAFYGSSGNTGMGYGTAGGAPNPPTGISVGASGQFDSTGDWEAIATLDQMLVGDNTYWSSRGPILNGLPGVDVTANGFWGAGSVQLNLVVDGWSSWARWGGTSRSAPLAMGVGALIADAFQQNHGRWPTWEETRQIMMQGANHIGYDTFSGGTGYLNAGRSAAIAGGDYGVQVWPESWTAGDFEGHEYPGTFAHIADPGAEYATTVTIENLGTDAVVTVSDYVLEPIAVVTHTFTSLDVADEAPYNFTRPDYLFDVEELLDGPIPEDSVMMVAELLQSYDTFNVDPSERTSQSNLFRLVPLDWTDIDGDGSLWIDADADGCVDPDEIDQQEYLRYTYSYANSLYQEVQIGNPAERHHDGLFLAVQHRQRIAGNTPLTLRVTFYGRADWGALDASALAGTYSLEPNEDISQPITLTAPLDYGIYEGGIQVEVSTVIGIVPPYPGGPDEMLVEYTTVVPVVVNVAYQGDLTAEDEPVIFGEAGDAGALFSNDVVRPVMDWGAGRENSGEWRFFFLNQEVDPNAGGGQARLVARTTWEGETPPSDVDTYLLGPDYHFSSQMYGGSNPMFGSSYGYPGEVFGPYSLHIVGESESPFVEGGHWLFDTATGSNVDYAVGDFNRGLNEVLLHAHRFDGESFRQDYQVELGVIHAPEFLEWDNYDTQHVELTTNMEFPEGIAINAFGLSEVEIAEELGQFAPGPSTGQFNACVATYHYTFTISSLAELHVVIDNFRDGDDLDLFLLYDYNGDGQRDCSTEVIARDGHGSPDPESVHLSNPPSGTYWVAVDPYAVGADGDEFDLFIYGLEKGDLIAIENLDADAFGPDDPVSFDVYNTAGNCDDETRSCLPGMVQVWLDTDPPYPLFNIPVHPRYNRLEMDTLSYKEVAEVAALPGDYLHYTIHLINSASNGGTVSVLDTLPSDLTFIAANTDYDYTYNIGTNTIFWPEVPVAAGGGDITSADYDWIDISGVGDAWISPFDWWGAFDLGDDDEGFVEVTLPFDYPFFGDDYDVAFIDANGQLTFDWFSAYASAYNSDGQLPGYDFFWPGDYRIAVLHGDQAGTISGGANTGLPFVGTVYTYHDEGDPGDPDDDRFIIQWDEWQWSWRPCYYYGAGCDVPYPDNTYQLILYPDGRAKAQYAEINDLPILVNTGAPSQVGVEGPTSLIGLPEGYAWQLTPASGLAWEYTPQVTSETILTITAQIKSTSDGGLLCNESLVDDGYEHITTLTACTNVPDPAELIVSKTADTGEAITGDVVTFNVTITNTGPNSADVSYVDTLDEGLELADGGQVLTGTVTLNNGDAFTLEYTATVTSDVYNDWLCNEFVADNGHGWEYMDFVCLDANVLDLGGSTKQVTHDGTPSPGETVTYEVEVANGSLIATGAHVSDTLPAGLIFGAIVEPAGATYSAATRRIEADFASIAPGATASLIFTATVDNYPDGTVVTNKATITDGDGETWNRTVTFNIYNTDFTTSIKTGADTALPGDSFIYTIEVVNSGSIAGTAVLADPMPDALEVLTDMLVPDLTYDPGTHTVSWSGEVGVGASEVLTIPVRVLRVPSQTIVNSASILGGGSTTECAWATQISSAELIVAKSIEGLLEYAMPYIESAEYTLVIENIGTISTTVAVIDPLPAGVVVLVDELDAGVEYDAESHTVAWEGAIDPSQIVEVTIPVVGSLEGALDDRSLFNRFYATDEWGQVYESNNTSLQLLSPDILVQKFSNVDVVEPGDVVTYTVYIENVGDYATIHYWGTGWSAVMADTLPDGVSYIPDSIQFVDFPPGPLPTCVTSDSAIACSFNVMPYWTANQLAFRYAVRVDEDVTDGTLLVNTVSVNDSFGILSHGEKTVEVVAPEIDATPLDLGSELAAGLTDTDTLTIRNVGGLPLTWTLAEDPAAGWLSAAPTSGTLLPDAFADVTLTYDSTGLAPGVYTTTLRLTSNAATQPVMELDVVLTVESHVIYLPLVTRATP